MAETEHQFTIDIVDLTTRFGSNALDRLGEIAHHALIAENAEGAWTISIVLTTDEHLQELHRDYLDDDTLTDIMTFPIEDPLVPGSRGGELVISLDRATEQAMEAGWQVEKELAFLVIHGVLHLLGWEDSTPFARKDMLARQEAILASPDAGADQDP